MRETRSLPDSSVRWPTADEARLLDRLPAIVLGVAGTSGKTITADLIRVLLDAAGFRVSLGLEAAVERADRLTGRDVVVLPLPLTAEPEPGAAAVDALVVTGASADELAAGEAFDRVSATLQRAMRAARSALVVNADDPRVLAMASQADVPVRTAGLSNGHGGATLRERQVVLQIDGIRHYAPLPEEAPFAPGGLATDLLLAAETASILGATAEHVRSVLSRHAPPRHHHELIGVRDGVRWIDDGAATRPGRTAATLQARGAPVILIAGGVYGGQPLARWSDAVARRCPHVLLFGPVADEMSRALDRVRATERIVRCADLEDAVAIAPRFAERGETVLYSPGCAVARRARARFRELASLDRTRREAA